MRGTSRNFLNFKVMSLLKFSFLFFILLSASTSNSYGHIPSNLNTSTSITNAIKGGGIIVMDDVIMAVTVYDPSDKIFQITVFNAQQEVVFQDNSCSNNQCSFNLSSLQSGVYTVRVDTHQNDLFTGEISR